MITKHTPGSELIWHMFAHNPTIVDGFDRLASAAQAPATGDDAHIFDRVLDRLFVAFSDQKRAAFTQEFRREAQQGERAVAAYAGYLYFLLTNPFHVHDMDEVRPLKVPLAPTDITAVIDAQCACTNKRHGISQFEFPLAKTEDAWLRNDVPFTPTARPETNPALYLEDLLGRGRIPHYQKNFREDWAHRHRVPDAQQLTPHYLTDEFRHDLGRIFDWLKTPCADCSQRYEVLAINTRYEPELGTTELISASRQGLNTDMKVFSFQFGSKLKYYLKLARLTGLRDPAISEGFRERNLKPWRDLYRIRIALNLNALEEPPAHVEDTLNAAWNLIRKDPFCSEEEWWYLRNPPKRGKPTSFRTFRRRSIAPASWHTLPHWGLKNRPVLDDPCARFYSPFALRRIDAYTHDPASSLWSYPVEIQVVSIDQLVRNQQAPLSDLCKHLQRRAAAQENWGPREWALFAYVTQTGTLDRFPGAHGESRLTVPAPYAEIAVNY